MNFEFERSDAPSATHGRRAASATRRSPPVCPEWRPYPPIGRELLILFNSLVRRSATHGRRAASATRRSPPDCPAGVLTRPAGVLTRPLGRTSLILCGHHSSYLDHRCDLHSTALRSPPTHILLIFSSSLQSTNSLSSNMQGLNSYIFTTIHDK